MNGCTLPVSAVDQLEQMTTAKQYREVASRLQVCRSPSPLPPPPPPRLSQRARW